MDPIPNSLIVNTGEQEIVLKTIDDFFSDTKNHLMKHYGAQELHFEIKSGEISYNSTQITDDRITYLSYQERILASVFETRTESNHIQYTFFRNLNEFEETA